MDDRYALTITLLAILVLVRVVIFYAQRSKAGRITVSRDALIVDSADSSSILSYYTQNHEITNIARGTLNGMAYSLYLTEPMTPDDPSVASIYTLDIPFTTDTHLIGLSKNHVIDRLTFGEFLKNQGMEKIELEGDFPDYFDIYAPKGQDVNVRVVLNPESMGFAVDYCRSHFWEINRAEMYFVIANGDTAGESIVTESQQFVDQIRPALTIGVAPVEHEKAYGEYDGNTPKCPICNTEMPIQQEWAMCPNGHGLLINGRDLGKLHDGDLQITLPSVTPVKHEGITCPHCGNQMVETAYEDGAISIDACENCPYRWIDADKVAPLTGTKSDDDTVVL